MKEEMRKRTLYIPESVDKLAITGIGIILEQN
jgi:hypothetical protein